MGETADILNTAEMKQRYGSFYQRGQKLELDRAKVPERLWPLLPYAEFWGIADDLDRELLVKEAPKDLQQNFEAVVDSFDGELDEWLAGPEADERNPSDEYVAYSAMRMAADYI